MTIDDAMSALLEVGGQQFKTNVELYGAVHTDELRYTLTSPDQQQNDFAVAFACRGASIVMLNQPPLSK